MEYALMALFLIFQNLLNLLLNLEVADGVPLGGVIIALMIIGLFLHNFRMRNESGGSSGNFKKKDGD